jgi:hypothetical protein
MSRLVALDVSGNRLTRKGIDALWQTRADWRTAIDVSDNLATPDPDDQPPDPADRSQPQPLDHAVGEVLRRLVPAPRAVSPG